MLSSTDCKKCGGEFIVRPQGGFRYVCGLCQPPSRAGKTRKLALAGVAAAATVAAGNAVA